MLELKDVAVSYGPISAVKGISVTIAKEEIVALLGANGAGKTTTLKAVSQTVKLDSGSILFQGRELTEMKPHEIVEAGISHCPEGRRIFSDLTVLENLQMGAYCIADAKKQKTTLEKVYHYFPKIADRQKQKGGTLSGGEQQMLAIGRALMNNPKLLMLDEPSLGLAPMIVERIFEIIQQINREERVTIFLVEQNANEALLHAHRAYILETGKVIMSGDADELLDDPAVKAAYLGA